MSSDYHVLTVNCDTEVFTKLECYQSLDSQCYVGLTKKCLKLMNAETLQDSAEIRNSKIRFCATSDMDSDGSDPITAIITDNSTSVQLWCLANGTLVSTVNIPNMKATSLAIYRGSQFYIGVGLEDYSLLLWDVSKNCLAQTFTGHTGVIHSISISSSICTLEIVDANDIPSLCIASAASDNSARTWNIEKGKRAKVFDHDWDINSLVIANKRLKRPILATGCNEGVIKLWDMKSGIGLRTLSGHLARITALRVYEGYQVLLVTCSADHTLRVFDMVSGENLAVLLGHREEVYSACIIGDDNPMVISTSRDRTHRKWSLQSIIRDYYYPEGSEHLARSEEVDSERVGDRNTSKVVRLPEVAYVPSLLESDDDSEEEGEEGGEEEGEGGEGGEGGGEWEGEEEGEEEGEGAETEQMEGEDHSEEEESDDFSKADDMQSPIPPLPSDNKVHPTGEHGNYSTMATASMIVRKLSVSVVNSLFSRMTSVGIQPDCETSTEEVVQATALTSLPKQSARGGKSRSKVSSTPTPRNTRNKVIEKVALPKNSSKLKNSLSSSRSSNVKEGPEHAPGRPRQWRPKRPKETVGRVGAVIQQYGAVLSGEDADALKREKEEKLRQRKQLMQKRRQDMDSSVERAVLAAKKRMEDIKKYI